MLVNLDRHQPILSFFKPFKMVTNYLRTTNCIEFQQLFERRFPDSVSSAKMMSWKNDKKYKTKGSSRNLSRNGSGRRRTERTQEDINLQEKLIEDPRIWFGHW